MKKLTIGGPGQYVKVFTIFFGQVRAVDSFSEKLNHFFEEATARRIIIGEFNCKLLLLFFEYVYFSELNSPIIVLGEF